MDVKTEAKAEQIILRHLIGSKAGQVDRLDLGSSIEIAIGRKPGSRIAFDPDKDDLVSGDHARIHWSVTEPEVFTLTDLGSKNGTFVNNQRVTSPVRLRVGDQIQFGPEGPKMEFDCDPRPESLVKTTRMASASSNLSLEAPGLRPTRSSNEAPEAGQNVAGSSPKAAENGSAIKQNTGAISDTGRRASPGRTTVWNMVANAQRQTRRQMILGLAVLAVTGGFLAWNFWPKTPVLSAVCDPKCVASKFGSTTVKINVTWKLISPSGGLVYHQYMLNQKPNSEEKMIPGGPNYIALYVKVDNQTIEPYLSYDGNKASVPIGGSHTGTGFFVSSNGFILTNRHVAATWEQIYEFPDSANIGFVYAADKKTPIGMIRQAPDTWIPAKTKQEFGAFKGANDKLEVGLPGSSSPVRSDLKRVSDRHDVALIKIDMPEAAPMVELNDNYESIKEGESITILGYPSVTAPTFGFIRSAENPMLDVQTREIPRVTVTPGNIGAILRDNGEGKDRIVSRLGDAYQLTANATGAGNSGGPVFDDQGHVVGIFYAGRRVGGASVTYAVPIRYGKELMSLR